MPQKPVVRVDTLRAYMFECPHCGGIVLVPYGSVNCQIFRHAVLKRTLQQINPHAPRDECERLVAQDAIFGCGKPFRISRGAGDTDWTVVDECDYI